jgi:putative hydrolase of HD superfamily
MMLADEVNARGLSVDSERVIRMALVHDWAETRVGDMPRTANVYFGSDARKHAESAAFSDIVRGIGRAESAYQALYKDYEERNSLEARLVKAADIIDLLVQAYALERSGARSLDEFWEVAERPDFKLPQIADQVVQELLKSLLEARSKIE